MERLSHLFKGVPRYMNEKIALSPRNEQIRNTMIICAAVALFIVSLNQLDLDLETFISRLERLPRILGLFMSLDFTIIRDAMGELVLSIAMALSALAMGGILSLILGFLAAENTAPNRVVATIIKGFVSTIRAIPSVVLILLIIASLGLGYIAAVTSLTLSSMGYLTKAFASTIEDQSSDLTETMRSTGANWFQIVVHGFFPNVLPSFLAWVSIRLEMSISESISLGIIGAAGIGRMLSRAMRNHQHAQVSTLILIIFATMLAIEILLNLVKKKANA